MRVASEHCNTLQYTATATHCNTLHLTDGLHPFIHKWHTATHSNTLQHAATHCNCCNTLQHAATRCNTLQHTSSLTSNIPHACTCATTATQCNTHFHSWVTYHSHAPCTMTHPLNRDMTPAPSCTMMHSPTSATTHSFTRDAHLFFAHR